MYFYKIDVIPNLLPNRRINDPPTMKVDIYLLQQGYIKANAF